MNPLLEAAKNLNEPAGGTGAGQPAEAPKDNGVGSFERFMSSFGSPRRWAGH